MDAKPYDLFVIERWELDRLSRLATRLFAENRMDGDAMRDAAQLVSGIVARACEIDAKDDPNMVQARAERTVARCVRRYQYEVRTGRDWHTAPTDPADTPPEEW